MSVQKVTRTGAAGFLTETWLETIWRLTSLAGSRNFTTNPHPDPNPNPKVFRIVEKNFYSSLKQEKKA